MLCIPQSMFLTQETCTPDRLEEEGRQRRKLGQICNEADMKRQREEISMNTCL